MIVSANISVILQLSCSKKRGGRISFFLLNLAYAGKPVVTAVKINIDHGSYYRKLFVRMYTLDDIRRLAALNLFKHEYVVRCYTKHKLIEYRIIREKNYIENEYNK